MNRATTHWRLERDADGIAWLTLDHAASSTNVLSVAVLEQLDELLGVLEKEPPAGLVILSGKSGGFIAGADVHEIAAVTDAEEALALVRRAQGIFDRLAALPFATVAAISGFCLGGGLELALACRYRIADEAPSTRLGLPEVMLGFHPGWGGTVRLTRKIGPLAALDLILSGRTVDARKARRLGLVDDVVPLRHLRRAAAIWIRERPAERRPKWWLEVLNLAPAREVLARLVARRVARRARKEHYPAPYAAIELWRRHGGDWAAMMRGEAESAVRLAMTPTARNLIRLYGLREQLIALGKRGDFPLRHVHVVGAGTMGGDIAAWCALRGFRVTLQDRSAEQIAPAIERAARLFERRLKQPHRVQDALDRLIPDLAGDGIARADLVIEAVFEDLEVKRALFREIEARAPDHALLATNTSSIPLEEIGEALREPERLVGLHFFNPVAKMQLVEVVRGEATDPEVVARACHAVRKLDRLPLPVKSAPGFLVNRVLMPYLMEAVTLVDEGVAPEVVDEAARRFGMPLGPVELADMVGLDVCLSVARVLTQHYGGSIPAQLQQRVQEGRLGRKSGQGFYNYKQKRRFWQRPVDLSSANDEMAERMILRLVNEARICLEEGVVDSPDLLDAGLVFGAGFAPFRGGVMRYVEQLGEEKVNQKLKEFAERFGGRFQAPGSSLQ
ncbi:MAG: 3-hydroxyacyl-CoA dehydrogenase NAD-binding domain-containing protein [Gammaproteobacteria bacterium]